MFLPCLIAFYIAMFDCYLVGPCSFLMGGVGVHLLERGGRGNCSQDILNERRIYFQLKKRKKKMYLIDLMQIYQIDPMSQ